MKTPSIFGTVQVCGRPPVCRFTESLTPCPLSRRNTGPEARLIGRPEVCPTSGLEELSILNVEDEIIQIEDLTRRAELPGHPPRPFPPITGCQRRETVLFAKS